MSNSVVPTPSVRHRAGVVGLLDVEAVVGLHQCLRDALDVVDERPALAPCSWLPVCAVQIADMARRALLRRARARLPRLRPRGMRPAGADRRDDGSTRRGGSLRRLTSYGY